MDAALWSKVKEIAFEAMDRDPAERGAYLASACSGDAALLAKVQGLLRAHDSAERGEFLDPPSIVGASGDVPRPSDEAGALVGTRIGRYRVKRLIGTGGMGAVYEAVQEQPRRTVALKVMRSGLGSRSVARRFEYEAQLLARLRHPGIAQVFEAGEHEGSHGTVPYFAMEYIPGARPITKYVEGKGLAVRQRLGLFASVCEAVHHGHQKGIVHRDLKPTNILVDSSGQPKIIDFGVARATDSDLAVTTLQTDVGQLVGTLQYMSPEQCAADPNDIDTRSDVYSLGVVLYELLTGKPPYEVSGVPVYEAPRIIREQPPVRPSSVDAALGGDVQVIVLKALEKDRAQRYQSALDLAADIRRYLSGEAISARPPSVAYQVRIFARRHRPVVIGAAAVLAALLVGLGAAAAGFTRALAARDRARLAEGEARAQAARAEKIAGFLRATLASADPTVVVSPRAAQTLMADADYSPWELRVYGMWEYAGEPGRLVSVADLLRAAGRRLDGAFADDPSIRGELSYLIGAALGQQMAWPDSVDLLRKALRLQSQTLGPNNEATIATALLLASGEGTIGNYEGAEEVLREAVDACRRTFGRADGRTLQAGRQRTENLLSIEGRRLDAPKVHQETLDFLTRALGPDHPLTLVEQAHLARLLTATGRVPEAEPLARRAVEGLMKDPGPDRRPTIDAAATLAYILRVKGGREPVKEAAQLTRSAVAFYESKMGPDYGATNELRKAAIEQCVLLGRYDQAEPFARAILDSNTRVFGPDSITTVKAAARLARVLIGAGVKLEEAEELARDSAVRTPRITNDTEDYAVFHRATYAAAVRARGRVEEALPMARSIHELATEPGSISAPWVRGYVGSVLGDCLIDLKRRDEAVPVLTEALAQVEKWGDPNNSIRMGILRSLIRVHLLAGDTAEAERWRKLLPVEDPGR